MYIVSEMRFQVGHRNGPKFHTSHELLGPKPCAFLSGHFLLAACLCCRHAAVSSAGLWFTELKPRPRAYWLHLGIWVLWKVSKM